LKKKILISFGTRPEAIKLAKLIYFLKKEKTFNVKICVSGQHEQMLKQVLKLFNIKTDYNLKVMKSNQSLNLLASKILEKFNKVLIDFKPDLILVHGDTTTAYISSLAAFQNKIKIGHVEAGLRTHNLEYPYPEEFNRKSIATIADINFTPTNIATKNLLSENVVKKKIIQTGNTIVDTLEFSIEILKRNKKILNNIKKNFSFLDNKKKLIIVTSHRRENYGNGIENICNALKKIVSKNKDIQIVYSVHLNPKVSTVIKKKLNNIKDIFLVKPQDYFTFIYLMKISYLILTDSGGIQEEAPTFKTPVLVLRNETERPEAKDFGGSLLVGTDKDKIADTVYRLMNNHKLYKKMSYIKNPYGDGKSINKIIKHLKKYLSK
jgi:UDP-N-acetylglucosamine 2-epimerase (non-hydrolysing)